MKTRTHRPQPEQEHDEATGSLSFEETGEDSLAELEELSEEELEALLFEEETRTKGPFNLPTIAGLSLILVGVGYLFQQLGLWNGLDFSLLAAMLPWLAGILIILLGFGVLSWSPDRKKKRARARAKAAARQQRSRTRTASTSERQSTPSLTEKRRLRKSRNKKISGVCAGIAEYFNIDPTLVRIAFVIGTIASGGPFILAYIILAMIMPGPEKPSKLTPEERIRIIRDS
ncbi:MAG: hypothetical protein KatS3mg043_0312 [Rhodothermaceae bacterium]|nr:MAG: hypothetical protein KatS3mg043_0312 [Rhodothermaceae bacterium]